MYHPPLVLRGEPAGAHHTRSHTYAHAGLIARNHICTTAFNCRRSAENNKQTRSVLDREASTGSSIHSQMEAAQMKVNYRPLLCLLTALMEFALTRRIIKKKKTYNRSGSYLNWQGTRGDCGERENLQLRGATATCSAFHINAKSSKSVSQGAKPRNSPPNP